MEPISELQSILYSAFDTTPAPITEFLQWLALTYTLPSHLSVLDIGCGTGKMLKELAKLKWQVTGMEPDADFYQRAQEISLTHPNMCVIQGGFNDLNLTNAFDLITAINDPFHYLLDIEQRNDAIRRMYEALRPGGVVFLEMTNFLYKLRYYEAAYEETAVVNGRLVTHLMQNEINYHDALWIHRDEYIVEGYPTIITKTHSLAIILPPEILHLLSKNGFQRVQTYNSYDARAEEILSGKFMLISAQKPL